MATVRQYIDSFNKGDAPGMTAMCAVPMSILDGMAPHVWHGPAASDDWYRDVLVEGEHAGATDYFVELDEPRHVNITGDAAYVVVPTTMSFKLRGNPIRQSGATFTVALRKVNDGWRIAAWAWAKGTAQPQP
jgi:ketosteroid isomerase-like protein